VVNLGGKVTGCSTCQALVLAAFSVVVLRLTGSYPRLPMIFSSFIVSDPVGATLSPTRVDVSTPFCPLSDHSTVLGPLGDVGREHAVLPFSQI
jgi:hypothetical protein